MFTTSVIRAKLCVALLTALAATVAAQVGPLFPDAQAGDPQLQPADQAEPAAAPAGEPDQIAQLDQPALDGSADQPAPEGVEALARGPIHEAFAEPYSKDAKTSLVVTKQPPEDIQEQPPDVKPDGDVIWIPGYWSWDDERSDFLWVSGTWRIPPTDQRWVPGYWGQVPGGYKWVAGFWTAADVQQVSYLPEPPQTVEQGPSSPVPGEDYFWVPGNWGWRVSNYAWTPGYWAHVQPNWVWTPAHYNSAPAGYVYCAGYWDYPLARRGWLFAPCYFNSPVYAQAGFSLTPWVVVSTPALALNLFVRPDCNAYFFGDYYDRRYANHYVPWNQWGRRTYDPIYTYQRWQNRGNPNWNREFDQRFAERQRNPSAPPPRTFDARRDRDNLTMPLNRFVSQEGVRDRVEHLQRQQRDQFAREGRDLRQFEKQRQKLELANDPQRRQQGGARERVTLRLPTMDRTGLDQTPGGRGRDSIGVRDSDNTRDLRGRNFNNRTQEQARDAARALRERDRARQGDGQRDVGQREQPGVERSRDQVNRQQAERIRREAQQRAEVDRARSNRQVDPDQIDRNQFNRQQAERIRQQRDQVERARRNRQIDPDQIDRGRRGADQFSDQPFDGRPRRSDDAGDRARQVQRAQEQQLRQRSQQQQFERGRNNEETQRRGRSGAELQNQQQLEQLRASQNAERARATAQQQQQRGQIDQQQRLQQMQQQRASQDAQRARAGQQQQQQAQMQQQQQRAQQMQQQQQRAQQMQQQQQRAQQRASQEAQRAHQQQRNQAPQIRREVARPVQQPQPQRRVEAPRDPGRQGGGRPPQGEGQRERKRR